MADLEGRNFIVTGANTGIGRVTAETLADRGATVILACRSPERTQPVIDGIVDKHGKDRAIFVPLDLGSIESIEHAAQMILDRNMPIDCLINNAGLAGVKGKTKDGFETTIGVNHLGPFLFTLLLIEKIAKSERARIVNVASKAHYRAKEIPFDKFRDETATKTGFPEYEISKLANVLFTKSLAKRLEGTGVTTYSLHPGVVASDIWRKVPGLFQPVIKLFMISTEEGAQTSLYCATSPDCADENGLYYDESTAKKPSRLSRDEELAEKLWEWSLEATGAHWPL